MVNAQSVIGSEKRPDAGINCNYGEDENSQAYGEIVSCFTHLAEDKISQPFNTQKGFVTSNKYPDGNPGFNLNVFDIRHTQVYSSAQPIRVKFDFRPAVPAATSLIENALLLRNNLVSKSSDGQKQNFLI